jgi:hypothetical protein
MALELVECGADACRLGEPLEWRGFPIADESQLGVPAIPDDT